MVTRLVAEIAGQYYELISLDLQLEVLRHNIDLMKSSLHVVELQQQAARVTSLAVKRFEAQLLRFQARELDIAQQIVETENELNFLAGRFPQPVERESAGFMQTAPMAIRVGVPAQLLENRPDVRQAELELRAAALDVNAARARFYPALSLEGGVGLQSYDITRLFSPGSMLYGLFAHITAPLLNRSAITAGYFGANARQKQAVLEYERSILDAFIEVRTP